jgi:hypothetical protein
VRDYLSYHNTLADSLNINWTLNTTYRNFEDSVSYYLTNIYSTPNTPTYSSTQQRGYSHIGYKNFMLTPTFDLYYKEVVNAQGGFVALLDNGKATPGTGPAGHFFPFLTTSFSPLKLIGITFIRWQIYASYARQSPLLADDYSTLTTFNLMTPPGSVPYNVANFNQYQQYNNYQTGTSVGLTRNFSITYSYEYKNYQYFAESLGNPDFNGGIQYLPYNGRTVTSRFSLHYNLHAHNFTWNAALNGAETHLEVVDNPALAAAFNSSYLDAGHRWSGGYTNRLEFNNVFAGLDFLYQDGARPDNLINALPTANNFIAPSANDSFTLQNAYFGVRIKIPHLKFAEIYANGRNILQNGSSNITDNRRFFGGGFKAGF